MDAYLSVYSLSLLTRALLTCVFLKSTSIHRATHTRNNFWMNGLWDEWLYCMLAKKLHAQILVNSFILNNTCAKKYRSMCVRINVYVSNPNFWLMNESFYPLDGVEIHEHGVLLMNSGFVIRKSQGHYCVQRNGSLSLLSSWKWAWSSLLLKWWLPLWISCFENRLTSCFSDLILFCK